MQENSSFFLAARERFPALAQRADRHCLNYWREPPSAQTAYSWFESAANALNDEMRREGSLVACSEFFGFVASIFASGSEEVRQCIDVSFVENLFRQVPPSKAAAYWKKLPRQLQELYLDFHNKPPL